MRVFARRPLRARPDPKHKLISDIRQRHAVEIQPPGADLLFDLEQLVEIGIALLVEAGEVIARTAIETVDPKLGHIAQVFFRQIAVPDGYFCIVPFLR